MAAIDKTYGTLAQARAMEDWLSKHRTKLLGRCYGAEDFDHLDPEEERPIINTGTSQDKWLVRYCPLEFYLERMLEVYGPHHKVHILAKAKLEKVRGRNSR